MTASFMWTGEYTPFNDGGWITKNPATIVICTLLTLISTGLTVHYLCFKDSKETRRNLFIAVVIMFAIAIVFVIGGVDIMWIDILAMTYALIKSHEHYMNHRETSLLAQSEV